MESAVSCRSIHTGPRQWQRPGPIVTVRNVVAANLCFHSCLSFCLQGVADTPRQTPPGQTPPGQMPPRQTPPGQTLPWADTPQADTCLGRHPTGRHTPLGRHLPDQCMLGYDSHCSRRYTSYWNAFLFPIVLALSCSHTV